MYDLNINIRPITQEDLPYIYSSWVFSSVKEKKKRIQNDKEKIGRLSYLFDEAWMSAATHSLASELIDQSEVYVACDPQHQDEIYGYVVAEPSKRILHWIYTKEPFRQAYVATRLLSHVFGGFDQQIYVTTSTYALKHHYNRWNLKWDSTKLELK